MDDLLLLNDELDRLDGEINKASEEAEDARIAMDRSGLEYDITFQSVMFTCKAGGDSDTKAKSKAVIASEQQAIKRIEAEGKYRKAKIQLENLMNQRDSMKEKSYNIRASVKTFGG